MQCAMGADLSQGDDFCAFVPVPEQERTRRPNALLYPQTLSLLPAAMRLKF